MHQRDSTLDEELLDEEGPAPEEALRPDTSSAAADTAARPVFLTQGGRRVFGGGGIMPDLMVDRDSLPRLTAVVEQRGLAFRFANRWINRNPKERLELRPREALSEPLWKEFVGVPQVRGRHVGRDGARRPSAKRSIAPCGASWRGASAAMRRRQGMALAGDPLFQRAVEVLSRARNARDVFALAGSNGEGAKQRQAVGRGSGTGRGRRSPAPSGTGSDGR